MKKKNYFLRALLIYCLVLALILGGGLVVLNRFLVSYEASRPDGSVEAYMDSHGREHWLGGLQELINAGLSEFTLATAAPEDFGLDRNGAITWRSAGGDDSSKYYEVRLGSAKICTLSLSQIEDVGFGMHSWAVTGEEFHMPGGSDITISVPTGCTASINGVEVGSGYISGMGSLELSPEHSFDSAPSCDIYTIENMLGPAEIKAFSPEGEELEARSISAAHVEFIPEARESFSFCALESAAVTVNGQPLSADYAVPVDLGLGDNLGIVRYECDGLFAQPSISVEKAEAREMNIGLSYIPGAGDDIDGALADFIEGFIYAYVDFSANKNRSADANFAVLAQYLDRDSELYTLTANTIENIAWASTSGLEYNSISYSDLIPLGDGRYVCSIYYDISYTLGVNDLDVQTGNLILIEERGGGYCVSAMAAGI